MNPTGALSNSKTAVKKLKNQRLTDFINEVAATIPDPDHFVSPSSSLDFPKPKKKKHADIIRYKPYSLIDLEREQIFKQYQLGDDEPPLLFVGRHTLKVRKDSPQVQEIVNSLVQFKELSNDGEYQPEYCPGFA